MRPFLAAISTVIFGGLTITPALGGQTKPETSTVTIIRGHWQPPGSLRRADSRAVVDAIRKSLGERESKYAIAVTRFFGRDSAYAEAVMGAMHIRYKLDRTNGVWVKRPAELLTIYNYGPRARTRAAP